MPQRFLRPGIRNSALWNSVSFQAQSLYVRLLTIVDDFGRCDGRPAVIHGECFSVWNALNPETPVDLLNLQQLLQQLAAKNLVDWYEESGKQIVQVTQWQERLR